MMDLCANVRGPKRRDCWLCRALCGAFHMVLYGCRMDLCCYKWPASSAATGVFWLKLGICKGICWASL